MWHAIFIPGGLSPPEFSCAFFMGQKEPPLKKKSAPLTKKKRPPEEEKAPPWKGGSARKFTSPHQKCYMEHRVVGILPSVNELMSAQISSLAELLFAFCGLVWFLSTVGEHVSDYVISE